MKENCLQISPTIPSLVDDGDLADDEISIDDQEPSLPSRSEMFVENSQESSRISMILGNHVFKRNKKMANGIHL